MNPVSVFFIPQLFSKSFLVITFIPFPFLMFCLPFSFSLSRQFRRKPFGFFSRIYTPAPYFLSGVLNFTTLLFSFSILDPENPKNLNMKAFVRFPLAFVRFAYSKILWWAAWKNSCKISISSFYAFSFLSFLSNSFSFGGLGCFWKWRMVIREWCIKFLTLIIVKKKLAR